MAKKRKPARRRKPTDRGLRGLDRKLDTIIRQNRRLTVNVEGLRKSIKALDDETSNMAARFAAKQAAQDAAIQALKDKIASGGTITEADLDPVGVDLQAEIDRLKGLAKDPETPVPAEPLPPV